jgi:hypothetical protein
MYAWLIIRHFGTIINAPVQGWPPPLLERLKRNDEAESDKNILYQWELPQTTVQMREGLF